jgi:hypothetical protein
MKHLKVAVAALTLAFAGAAFAYSCPLEMKKIDAALQTAKLDAAKMAEVKKLRAEGEKLHKEGKHDESMKTLGKAKEMLGVM